MFDRAQGRRADGALADDDLKLKQMHELLKVHMTRRSNWEHFYLKRGKGFGQRGSSDNRAAAGGRRQLADGSHSAKSRCKCRSRWGDTSNGRSDAYGLNIEQPLQYINFRAIAPIISAR